MTTTNSGNEPQGTASQQSTQEPEATTDGQGTTKPASKPAKPAARKQDNTVRTRKATDDERKKGAKIEVGKATEVKPSDGETGDGAGNGKGSGNGNGAAEVHPERAALETRMKELQDKTSGLSSTESKELGEIRDALGVSSKSSAYDRAQASDKSRPPAKAKTKAARKIPEEISNAVKFARHTLHAKFPTLKADAHVPAASSGDHVAVRARATEMIEAEGGTVTPAAILKLSGMGSYKALTETATGRTPKAEMEPLQKLAAEFKKDKNASWRTGRYLAGILCAWIEDVRRAEKAEKDAAKKEKVAA